MTMLVYIRAYDEDPTAAASAMFDTAAARETVSGVAQGFGPPFLLSPQ